MESTDAKDTSNVELGNDDQLHACPSLLHQLQGFTMTITTHEQFQKPLEDF